MKKAKKVFAMLMMAAILTAGIIGGAGEKAKAYNTPKLLVTGADIEGGSVAAGDTFTMKLHLKNESDYKLVNISLKLSSEDNQIVTTSGSDSIWLESVGGNEEAEVSVELATRANLEQKNYSVKVEYTYEDNSWNTYSDTATVTVPVVQKSSASITEKRLSKKSIIVNGKTSLSFKVNNTGKGTLYNVTAEIAGDTISDMSSYVGTIAVGESGTVDLSLTGEKTGDTPINVTVTFEDAEGKTATISDTLELSVEEPVAETNVEETKSGNSAVLVIAVIVVIVLIIVIAGVVRRTRDKKYE